MASALSKPGLELVRQSDVPFSSVVPGLEISRGLTQAGFTSLGGGWVRMDGSGELKDWTLKYDETLFVVQGEAEVEDSSGKKVASPTRERLPMKRSIGARIRSPTRIVRSTVRSHSVLCSILRTSLSPQGLDSPSLVGRTDATAQE